MAVAAAGQHALLVVPLPRRIASRPVSWMAATMLDGAAVPSTNTNWFSRFASIFFTPGRKLVPSPSGRHTVRGESLPGRL